MNPIRWDLGGGLVVRSYTPDDDRALFDLIDANRARLRPWMIWEPTTKAVGDARAWIEACLASPVDMEGNGMWVDGELAGGVGLSAIMIAHALGAQVIAVDIDARVLSLAGTLGADVTLNAKENTDVPGAIRNATEGGADVSMDALGSVTTCANSILCLRKRGRHVQVGLLAGEDYMPRIPMHQVIARELEICGSHGMQAGKYSEMLAMIVAGKLNPQAMIGKTVPLEDTPSELAGMGQFGSVGITVIDRF